MADIGNDVFFATIPELNARLKSKEFSAEELARAFAEPAGAARTALQRAGASPAATGYPQGAGGG